MKRHNNGTLFLVSITTVIAFNFLQLYFMGPAIIVLVAGLTITWLVWVLTGYRRAKATRKMVFLFGTGILIQVAHFAEEYFTGFQQKLPMLIAGYTWSDQQFLVFNACWLFVFLLILQGMRKGSGIAYLFAWFFILVGEIGNGIFHPLLCLQSGGYFPGLFTSVPHLIVGILLLREFRKVLFLKNEKK